MRNGLGWVTAGLCCCVVAGCGSASAGSASSPTEVNAALTTGAVSNPQGAAGPTGANRRHELSYIQAAQRQAFGTSACRFRRAGVPAVSHGSPSRALLSILGVLRRPATAADRLPGALHHNASNAKGIYVNYIRLARVTNGISYYIVPAISATPILTPSAGCHAAMTAALRAELPRIPAPLRAPTVSLQAQMIARQRKLAEQRAGEGICLMTNSVNANTGTCGATASEIKQSGMTGMPWPLSGVVPDGVAAVTIHYPASNRLPALTITTDVVGNVFATSITRNVPGDLSPTVIWRSADGNLLKTVTGNRVATGGWCGGNASQKPGSHPCL